MNKTLLPQEAPKIDTTLCDIFLQNTGSSKAQIISISEKVRKCIRALEAAETDTEKFATLFLVPKLVKGTECNKDARLSLMKGIGYSFLARMLRSKDSPDGCPRLMFQSVALSVLSCFAQDEEIMTHPSVSSKHEKIQSIYLY